MAANTTSPQTLRTALANLIAAKLEGTGKPVQKVYDYLVAKFGALTPVICVGDDGDDPEPRHVGAAKFGTWFYFNIYAFVPYSDPDSGLSERDTENTLSTISKNLNDLLLENLGKGRSPTVPWDKILPSGKSSVDTVENLEGEEFRRLIKPVKVRIENDG
jgi:hypothetical protein